MNGLELVQQVSKLQGSRVGLWTWLRLLGPIRYCIFLQLSLCSSLHHCQSRKHVFLILKVCHRIEIIWTSSSNIWENPFINHGEVLTLLKWALALLPLLSFKRKRDLGWRSWNVHGGKDSLLLFSCISFCALIAWT